MPSNSYPFIAREGWPILTLLAVVYAFCYFYLDWQTAHLFSLLFAGCLFLFRDPAKIIPSIPLAVVSPIHGRVLSIDSMENVWLERKSQRVRIKMSMFDIFSLRSPIEGKVMDQWCKTLSEDGSLEYAYWIKTDEDDDVVTVIHLNKWKWFYRIYLQSGHRIGQGQRCGYLFFGCLIDVFVAKSCKLCVAPGDKIESGSSILGTIVHKKQATAVENHGSSIKKA